MWRWSRPRTLPCRRIELDSPGGTLEAVVHEPRRAEDPRHADWLVLHGVTYPGEEHPSLVRFARALAWSGGRVIIPEIRAWKRLDLDPAPGQVAVEAALRFAHEARPEGSSRPVGIVGFSFGCPQAVLAAARPEARGKVDGVVGFGGYADLERTVLFGLTGEYRDGTEARRIRPDPYGRWVVASNYLHRIPGLEEATDVSAALRDLAVLASRRKVMSWDPQYDPAKDEMERKIAPRRRSLFRLFAPPADREPDTAEAIRLAPLLAAAARDTHPSLDARHTLAGPVPPTHLFHGRYDHLIPWVETLALASHLESHADVDVTVTGLFAHSQERRRPIIDAKEIGRFFRALRRVLGIGGPTGSGGRTTSPPESGTAA